MTTPHPHSGAGLWLTPAAATVVHLPTRGAAHHRPDPSPRHPYGNGAGKVAFCPTAAC
ncbi:hypothetical protein ACTMTF_25270 [Nonomuraea sp. ZG12]|uniref:hypothetical protein n=1 Tax=Nonomuraea sp. ZG12 TaxID=3452207 RepID=UPI003F88707A